MSTSLTPSSLFSQVKAHPFDIFNLNIHSFEEPNIQLPDFSNAFKAESVQVETSNLDVYKYNIESLDDFEVTSLAINIMSE